MKILWAPWRMAFILAAKKNGCIFCEKSHARDARENLVLATTRSSVVLLNRYPYNSAHLLVAPRKHVADLDRLTLRERTDLDRALRGSMRILREALKPQGMNVGMNLGAVGGAGIADHLHWHIVPRWQGDTNFMPVIADVRVMPQHLLETYDTLYPRFAPLRRLRK